MNNLRSACAIWRVDGDSMTECIDLVCHLKAKVRNVEWWKGSNIMSKSGLTAKKGLQKVKWPREYVSMTDAALCILSVVLINFSCGETITSQLQFLPNHGTSHFLLSSLYLGSENSLLHSSTSCLYASLVIRCLVLLHPSLFLQPLLILFHFPICMFM